MKHGGNRTRRDWDTVIVAINLFTSVNTKLQIIHCDLWAIIHRTSTQTDWRGAHVNELLPPIEAGKLFISIFSKKWRNTGGLGYLLFASFIHHLPTTFRDSLSLIDCPIVSASLSVITTSISIYRRFLFKNYLMNKRIVLDAFAYYIIGNLGL